MLRLLVFLGGVVTLASELAAAKLMGPYFGTSNIVWSCLIGLILLALAIGNWIGGKWSDNDPSVERLLRLVFTAGVLVTAIPFFARWILKWSLLGFAQLELGLLLGSFVGTLALLGLPMILLGCITPYGIRLATTSLETMGKTTGQFFALGTLGSFIGAFLPVLWLIPWLGTTRTYIILGMILVVFVAVVSLTKRMKRLAAVALGTTAIGVGLFVLVGSWTVKPGEGVLFEGESVYQYVRVVEDKEGWRKLELNEGVVSHSRYHPDRPLTFMAWDFLALAPYFSAAPFDPHAAPARWAIIGAGGGTTARLIDRIYSDAEIHGVELDPLVVEVGERFFDPPKENYTVSVQDGRGWIHTTDEIFDYFCIDAYRQPYVPFELTTIEFFSEVSDHLSENGALTINVASPRSDHALVNVLCSTLAEVFPSVFYFRLPSRSSATIVVATKQPTTIEDYQRNAKLSQPFEKALVIIAGSRITNQYTKVTAYTDDHAPAERLMDLMVLREIRERSGKQ